MNILISICFGIFSQFSQKILSVLGHRIPDVPIPLFGVYPASKYALTAMVQTIRQELQFHNANIKVTVRIEKSGISQLSIFFTTCRTYMHWRKPHKTILLSSVSVFACTQSISPGMVDTEFLNAFNSVAYSSLPKLQTNDVTAALLYALGTPEYVQVSLTIKCNDIIHQFHVIFVRAQVDEIILQAICRPQAKLQVD